MGLEYVVARRSDMWSWCASLASRRRLAIAGAALIVARRAPSAEHVCTVFGQHVVLWRYERVA